MPTDRDELLRNILAKPEDDDLRLVYADWLEDRGRPDHANVVRFQCEAARLQPWERGWQEATWRANALLEQHGKSVRADLPALEGVEWLTVERGLVSSVRVRDVATLYKHADTIKDAAPIATVEVLELNESTTERPEGSVPWLDTVRLAADVEHTPSRTASLLDAAKKVELVDLEDGVPLEWFLDWFSVRASRREILSPLTELTVQGSHTVGLGFVRDLVEASEEAVANGQKPTLLRLDLGTLFVDHDSGYFEDPTMGAPGATVLAQANSLKRLEYLNVDRQRVGVAGLRELVAAFPRLRELHARSARCEDISAVFDAAGSRLERLDLSDNAFGNRGAEILASAERLAVLKWLELDTCEIGAEGLRALTQAPFWQTLHRLDLSRNPLEQAALEILADAPAPSTLHALAIADMDLAVEAGEIHALLSRIRWLHNLSSLDLSRNDLDGFEIARDLAGGAIRKLAIAKTGFTAKTAGNLAPLWRQLFHLDLRDNEIGDAGIAALITDEESELHVLDLGGCGLTDRGVAQLVDRAKCPHLYELRLRSNTLGANGIRRLVESPLMKQLRVLDLTNCTLTEDAARILAKSPPGLRTLRLTHNKLGEKGLVALAEATSLSDTDLVVTENTYKFSKESQALLDNRLGRGWQWRNARDDDFEDANDDDDE